MIHPAYPISIGSMPRRLALVVLMMLAALTFLASRAEAYIWFSDGGVTTAQLDGSNVHLRCQSAVDFAAKDANYLYYLVGQFNRTYNLGRANLDCSNDNPDFLDPPGGISAVAVDSTHIYWLGPDGIGRANLDGSGIDPQFIPSPPGTAIAVDQSHIYWGTSSPALQWSIGRANLDGSNANPDWLPVGGQPAAIAVDSDHLYWSEPGGIARANLDGSAVSERWLATDDLSGSPGLAIYGRHIYWSVSGIPGSIGRANLDGSGVNPNFVSGLSSPTWLFVDGLSGTVPVVTTACPTRVKIVFDLDTNEFDPAGGLPRCIVTVRGLASPAPLGMITITYPGAFVGDGAITCQLKPAGPNTGSCIAQEPLAYQDQEEVKRPGRLSFTAEYGGASDYLPTRSATFTVTTYAGQSTVKHHQPGSNHGTATLHSVSATPRGVVIRIGCSLHADHPCRLTAALSASSGGRTVAIGTLRITLQPGATRTVRVPFNRTGQHLHRLRGRLRVRIRIRVKQTTPAGSILVASRTLSVGRPGSTLTGFLAAGTFASSSRDA